MPGTSPSPQLAHVLARGGALRSVAIGMLAALVLVAPCVGQSPGEERRQVLILYGLQSAMPVVIDWDRGLRSAIESMTEVPVRIDREFLDLLRTQDDEYREQWLALLRAKYVHDDPDVILAMHEAAVEFVLAHRDEIFPGVPIVFGADHAHQGDERLAGLTPRLRLPL